MRVRSASVIASALLIASAVPAFANPKLRRGPTAPRLFKPRVVPPAVRPHVTAFNIEPARATQIQSALIRAGYLKGTPAGAWDAETQTAMEKLQADNGWSTKMVPDARAIIKLGLGSSYSPASVTASSAGDEVELAPSTEETAAPATEKH